jgi:hypothetical protein
MRVGLRGEQTARGDGTVMSARSTFGTNFADSKGNVFAHVELIDSDGLQANSRSFRNSNGGAVTNFLNGSVRNPNLDPTTFGGNNNAFLSGAADGVPTAANLPFLTAANVSPGGTIFNVNAGTGNGLVGGGAGSDRSAAPHLHGRQHSAHRCHTGCVQSRGGCSGPGDRLQLCDHRIADRLHPRAGIRSVRRDTSRGVD